MDGSSGALHLVRPSHHVLSVAKAADVRQKAEAAVLGALVGDAACLPLVRGGGAGLCWRGCG